MASDHTTTAPQTGDSGKGTSATTDSNDSVIRSIENHSIPLLSHLLVVHCVLQMDRVSDAPLPVGSHILAVPDGQFRVLVMRQIRELTLENL